MVGFFVRVAYSSTARPWGPQAQRARNLTKEFPIRIRYSMIVVITIKASQKP
jgi:hypothetical protein